MPFLSPPSILHYEYHTILTSILIQYRYQLTQSLSTCMYGQLWQPHNPSLTSGLAIQKRNQGDGDDDDFGDFYDAN